MKNTDIFNPNVKKIEPKDILNLSLYEQLDAIRYTTGKNKYDLIISMPNIKNIIRRLPPQDIFMMLKEVGFDNAPAILSAVTPGQFEAFLDLDCWHKDTFTEANFLPWLQALLETEEYQVTDVIVAIDAELLCLAIGRYINITAGPEDFDNEESENPRRIYGLYDIDYTDSETAKPIQHLLDILYRLDNPVYLRLMEGIRAEMRSTLEEEAYHFSTNRLEDLGFFSYHESRTIFSYADPKEFINNTEKKNPFPVDNQYGHSTYALSSIKPRGILADVLAMGVDNETVNELTLLLNRYFSAENEDKGNVDKAGPLASEIFNYLNIALEYIAGTDSQAAHTCFTNYYLIDLFRLGFNITVDLQRDIRRAANGISDWLDEPFTSLYEGLDNQKPLLYSGIIEENNGNIRPFKSMSEIRVTQKWIDHINIQRSLFQEHLPFSPVLPEDINLDSCQPNLTEELNLSTIFLTALANKLLNNNFSPIPLNKEQIPELIQLVFGPSGIQKKLHSETIDFIESILPEAGSFADFCLNIWNEELAELDPNQIQLSYIKSLIIKV